MTPEMVLYACMVDEPFQMTVAADGTLGEFGGLAEAVERIVNDKLQPPADERAQATLKMDGKSVVRPVTSTIKMTIGAPPSK